MLYQDRSSQDRSSYDRSFQDRLSQERSSQDSGQVMSSQDRFGLVRSTQDRDQFFLKSCVRDQVDHWTVASVYLDSNRTKRKALTWDSSVALLSPTCFLFFKPSLINPSFPSTLTIFTSLHILNIHILITCKKAGPYLKKSVRY